MSDQSQFSSRASRGTPREAAQGAVRRKIDCTAPEARRDGKALPGQPAREPVAGDDAGPVVDALDDARG